MRMEGGNLRHVVGEEALRAEAAVSEGLVSGSHRQRINGRPVDMAKEVPTDAKLLRGPNRIRRLAKRDNLGLSGVLTARAVLHHPEVSVRLGQVGVSLALSEGKAPNENFHGLTERHVHSLRFSGEMLGAREGPFRLSTVPLQTPCRL